MIRPTACQTLPLDRRLSPGRNQTCVADIQADCRFNTWCNLLRPGNNRPFTAATESPMTRAVSSMDISPSSRTSIAFRIPGVNLLIAADRIRLLSSRKRTLRDLGPSITEPPLDAKTGQILCNDRERHALLGIGLPKYSTWNRKQQGVCVCSDDGRREG